MLCFSDPATSFLWAVVWLCFSVLCDRGSFLGLGLLALWGGGWARGFLSRVFPRCPLGLPPHALPGGSAGSQSPLSSQGCPLCSWLPWPPQSSVTRLDPARGNTGVLSLITLSDQLTFRAALRKLGSKRPSSQALRGQVEGESTAACAASPLPSSVLLFLGSRGPPPQDRSGEAQGMGWGKMTLGLWSPLEAMGPGGEPTSPAGW